MRFPVLRTLSGRIIVGFAVLILTFGTVSVLTVVSMERLGREIRVIRTGHLPLALIAKDLSEKQKSLHSYLLDELTGESTPARVEYRVRRLRAARGRLLREAEQILAGLTEVPPAHQRRIDRTATWIAEVRRQVDEQRPLYKDLLEAPPLTGPFGTPAADEVRAAAGTEALERLRRGEGRLHTELWEFERQQRDFVERTALRLERNEQRLVLYTLYLGIVAVTLGLLITIWATVTLRPLRRLRDAARRIASGDYGSRIDESGPREVSDLAREFNVMGHAVEERERELVRSERLVAVGKMAAMIAHEVRNPLSSIGLNTELLEEELAALPEPQAAEARGLCRAITTEVDRLTAITEEYLLFARLPKPKLAPEPLPPLIGNLMNFEREQLALRSVELHVVLAKNLPAVLVDDAQLRQALLNLLRNAADALEEIGGGRVTVEARAVEDGGAVEIRVTDDGPGISEEIAPKLFDPFFSTKDGGTGLGLALTHQIVREHGGDIRVDSRPGHGASFVMTLPVATRAGG